MILYHPYKDANHCTYRLLSILTNLKEPLNLEQLKVVDFYYLFPHFLKEISPWPVNISKLKKLITEVDPPYENTPNRKKLFFDLEQIQNEAVLQLASKGLLSIDLLKNGAVKLNKEKVPKKLAKQIQDDRFNESSILRVLIEGLCNITWSGENGLKKRTGLMEYKYDE